MRRKVVLSLLVIGIMIFPGITAVSLLKSGVERAIVKEPILFGTSDSLNWAGYVVTGSDGSVANVSVSFIIPNTDTSGGSYAAFWVGIDGFSGSTVEQTGILAEPSGFGHKTTTVYEVWYEFYPAAPVYASFTAEAGDYVYANVTYNGGNSFTTYISVMTPSGSVIGTFGTTQVVSGAADNSAEWIVEAPASGGKILPLANFGTIYFGFDNTGIKMTNYATVNGNYGPMGGFSLTEVVMVSQTGQPKAAPSAVSSDGTSFSVSYDQSVGGHGR
ncbi:MAG: G1 family glutamic endopeptidase [Methanomassiliicoccales archaeon]